MPKWNSGLPIRSSRDSYSWDVGAVTGVVGAAGGLGGFFPPLVMGAVYSATGSYAWGYVLLALTAAAALVYTAMFINGGARRT
jgi:nitrate/nitrite transporter NarK